MRTSARILSALLVAAALWGGTAPSVVLAATASGARLGLQGEGVTRFVVDLSDQVPFKVTPLADPYRLAVDLAGVDFAGAPSVPKPWGAVNSLHLEGGRLILDLRRPALVKSAFIIPPRDGMGHRLVVDMAETTRDAFLAAARAQPPQVLRPPPAAAKAAPKPAPVPVAPVIEEARPLELPPAEASAPASSSGGRIVVTSPNAPVQAGAPIQTVQVPPPVQPAVVVTPQALPPAEPVNLIPPPVQVQVQAERVSAAQKSERTAKGTPMLSAPMPPPPERPVVSPPQPQAVAVPAPQPAVQPAVVPAGQSAMMQEAVQPPVAAPEKGVAKAKDGKPVIVIDPGHGGVDPGATGVSGAYEKHITLAMARELKAMLEKSGRFKVHLTRDRDVFIRLRERVAIARSLGADLFISLHADAVTSPQIRGLSVYTLSRNASDAEAQALAEKENKADLIAGIDLTHESADVAGILIDLAQRETMNRSAGFAGELVDEVGQEMDLLGNTHRFAGFAVLKAPDVPAVLVEMGYLSNDSEERLLRQPHYRARLAKAVTKAVERYFPPNLKARRP